MSDGASVWAGKIVNRADARSAKALPWRSDSLFVSFIVSVIFIILVLLLVFAFCLLIVAGNKFTNNGGLFILMLLFEGFVFSPGLLVSLAFPRYIARLRRGELRHKLYEGLAILAAFLTLLTCYALTYTWRDVLFFLSIYKSLSTPY